MAPSVKFRRQLKQRSHYNQSKDKQRMRKIQNSLLNTIGKIYDLIFNYRNMSIVILLIIITFSSRIYQLFVEFKNETVNGEIYVSLFKNYSSNFKELLSIRKKNMLKYNFTYGQIDKRSNLSLSEFYQVYDGKWPVIVTDLIRNWKAFNWTKTFFQEKYSEERIYMRAVKGTLDKSEGLALPMGLFLNHSNEGYPNSWTYLEDEVFLPTRKELLNDIGENIYLKEDFFQLFPQEIRPWNAMLLWGTPFSRSSLHIDPYNWTGTNAVLFGRKRWKLFEPGQDEYLNVILKRRSKFPLDCNKYNSQIDTFDENQNGLKALKFIEFDQLPGEILFIPSGWFHQAFNVEETLAVSSQVMNRNNYRIILEEILKIDNLNRTDLNSSVDNLSPREQTLEVLNKLPSYILKRGKEVTKQVLDQLKI